MTRFNTQLVHGLPVNDNTTGAVNPPIYNSSTYAFESVEAMPRWDYARSGNPTRDFLEQQIAQLEHGSRGFAFASGLAAIHAVISIFKPGDRIVVGKNIYGGTYSLFNEYFAERGITFEPVDTADYEALDAAVQGRERVTFDGCRLDETTPAKAVYFEVLTNPLLQVNNVGRISEIARRHGALTIVDNTFVTPYLQQPLDLGADIVLHSATKYLAGHSEVTAGLVVVKDDEIGRAIYFAQNRFGGVLAPAECNDVRRGIQTLALRVERQQENAQAVAEYLLAHPLIKTVHYPGVKGDRERLLADNGLRGFGGVLSFEVVPGVDPGIVLDNLHVFRLAVSLGAVESLAELPCRMTHFELPKEERLKVGITDELIRLAIGIEDAADLIEDLGQALDKAYEAYLRNHSELDTFSQLASGVFA
ncbi:aminotransferase class I/II-fold pyridoxal phosphate-dependent enzyme [Bifidobacterium sp. SO1]|uniref:trans-sulfuration enzyme family protein n=1 Tax=Bifidobacterium sp. SO1 TaxID=2809029 RepID=UPI001BDD9F20|nr:aminotransferase class I/II-fold pyridoxal phosphate-dependent enzyme [Bifidobacterium sp. SO1]MBT1161126.1 aminotransferase class I/II-fold pyridoxal phosphate-dependent enzyme [Bifidobacterium sp. SO1]